MSKNEDENNETEAIKDPAYEKKRDNLLSIIKLVTNLELKNTIEKSTSTPQFSEQEETSLGKRFLGGVKGTISYVTGLSKENVEVGAALFLDNPRQAPALIKAGYDAYTYDYYNDFKQLLNKGISSDSQNQLFFIKVIQDNETVNFLKKEENAASLALFAENITPKLIPIVINQFSKNKLVKDLENTKAGKKFVDEKMTPLATLAIKNLLTDPQKLMNLTKLVIEMNSTTDQIQREAKLAKIFNVIDMKQVLANTELLSVLNNELLRTGFNILKENDNFRGIINNLEQTGINDEYINKNFSSVTTSAINYLLNKPNLATIITLAGDITNDPTQKRDNLFKLLDNINASQMLAKTELPKILIQEREKLAKVTIEVLQSNNKFKKINKNLNVENKFLEKSLSIGINIVAQSAQNEDGLTAIYEKFKLVAQDNSTAEIGNIRNNPTKIAQLERQSLIKKLELGGAAADLIASDHTLKALQEIPNLLKENSVHISQIIENTQINYPDSTLSNFLKKIAGDGIEIQDTTNTKKIIYVDIKETEKLVSSFAEVADITLPIITKLVKESLANPQELGDIIQQTQKIINSKQGEGAKDNQKTEIKILILMLTEFKEKNPEVKTIIDQELPILLKENGERLGATLDVFLNQTKIGKKLQLDSADILAVAAKNTPQLIEIAELYAQNKYAAIIPKAIPILADKKIFVLVIEGGVNLIKSKISNNKQSGVKQQVEAAVGNDISKYVSDNKFNYQGGKPLNQKIRTP